MDIAIADHGSILRPPRRVLDGAPLFARRVGNVTDITDRGASVAMIMVRSPGAAACFCARKDTGKGPFDLRHRNRQRPVRNTGGATRPQ